MKRRVFSIALILTLVLALALPAQAATEYGHIYDESDLLYSEGLEALGTQLLPNFLETHDVDIRVDVLTGLGDLSTVQEAAEYIYEEYGYGGSDGTGVSLTLLVSADDDGLILEDWHICFVGDSRWTENASDCISDTTRSLLSVEMWSGDQAQDAQMLVGAIASLTQDLEAFFADTAPLEEPDAPAAEVEVLVPEAEPERGDEAPEEEPDEAPAAPIAPVQGGAEEAGLDNVTDAAKLLTLEQWRELEWQARLISEEYGVGVYIITVEDFTDHTNGFVEDAAEALYYGYSLGLGADKDGILLLLSMEDRDYDLMVNGDAAHYAFNDAGRAYMDDYFLDEFSENDWYGGFAEYLSWSADYLEKAKNGEPYSEDNAPMSGAERGVAIFMRIALILVVPLAVAGIYILVLLSKMKSVAKAVEASEYVSEELHLSGKRDLFTHKTQTRRKIETESSSGGGKTRSGGGGASHTSGKF